MNRRNTIKTEYELYCKRLFTLNTLFSIGIIGFQSVNDEIPVTDTQFRTPQSPFKFNASEWFFVFQDALSLFEKIFFRRFFKFVPARKRSCMSCACLFAFFQVGNSETCPYLILNMVQVRFSNVILEKIIKILKLKVSCYKNIVESAAEF